MTQDKTTNSDGDDIVGHKTFWNDDGTHRHEPLRRDEADEILAQFDSAKGRLEPCTVVVQ
jgi:hypothetical protein